MVSVPRADFSRLARHLMVHRQSKAELLAVSSPKSQCQRLMTPSEVADLLRVSTAWVRDHATRKQPHLPAVKVGKLLRFRMQDVEEFIEQWCQ